MRESQNMWVEKIKERNQQLLGQRVSIQKIDLLRDPTSNKIESLKAMVRIDNQIIQLTVDTASPVSLLNWATTKKVIEKSKKTQFMPAEKVNYTIRRL